MSDRPEDRANRARMAGKRDVSAIVVAEDVVEEGLQASLLGGVGFAHVRFPEWVVLREAGFEGVDGIGGVDVGFRGAAITSVDADGLAQELERFVSDAG